MKSSKSWLIYRGGSGLQTGLGETLACAGGQLTLFLLCGCHLSGKSRTSRRTNGPFPEYMHSPLGRQGGKPWHSPDLRNHSRGSVVVLVNGKFQKGSFQKLATVPVKCNEFTPFCLEVISDISHRPWIDRVLIAGETLGRETKSVEKHINRMSRTLAGADTIQAGVGVTC